MPGAPRLTARACAQFFLPLLFVAPFHFLRAQTSWDRYKPGTLAAIMQQHDSVIRASWDGTVPSEHFSGDNFPTIASVIYKGRGRPIDPTRLGIVRSWGKTFMRDTAIAQDFHREYLFQEGTKLLWLPVQDTVASFFAKELHAGQRVNLYVSWLGAYYAGREITWAFIVNEFEVEAAKP